MVVLRKLEQEDWPEVSKIYADGMATKVATFETEVPNWESWNKKHFDKCRLVATDKNDKVVGFAALAPVSTRPVYQGVAEVSVYVASDWYRKGVGELLLRQLVEESEASGYWTLQAGIFSENKASIDLHLKCGFRIVGLREKIGMLEGVWYDNQFLERRSKKFRN